MTSSRRKILFSGASGMIGAALVRAADAERIQTVQLIRREPANPGEIRWDPQSDQPVQDLTSLEGMDAAIHLSGANLASHRWTPPYKREILDSRIATTRMLVKTLKALKRPPETLLCASATGIYGDRGDEILTEESEPGQGFIADICRTWEAEAAVSADAGMRVVYLRFGVVLAAEGGALKRMLPIFRLGLGGRLGNGKQWIGWIAVGDMVRAVFHVLNSSMFQGPVNLVAPNPVTNAEFTHALGHTLHRPAIIPAPAVALRVALGEIADAALLASTRAVPDRLLSSGFSFELPHIASAFNAIL